MPGRRLSFTPPSRRCRHTGGRLLSSRLALAGTHLRVGQVLAVELLGAGGGVACEAHACMWEALGVGGWGSEGVAEVDGGTQGCQQAVRLCWDLAPVHSAPPAHPPVPELSLRLPYTMA